MTETFGKCMATGQLTTRGRTQLLDRVMESCADPEIDAIAEHLRIALKRNRTLRVGLNDARQILAAIGLILADGE